MKKLLKINIRFLTMVLSAIILSQSIYAYELGDVNMDGKVTSTDAAIVLQYVLNPDIIPLNDDQEFLAAVNKTDVITASNSSNIMKGVLDGDYVFENNKTNMLTEESLDYSPQDLSIYFGNGNYYCFFSAASLKKGIYTENVKLNDYMTLMATKENPVKVYNRTNEYIEDKYKESYENKICLPNLCTKEYGTIKIQVDRPTNVGIHYLGAFDPKKGDNIVNTRCYLYKDCDWSKYNYNDFFLKTMSWGGDAILNAGGSKPVQINATHTYVRIDEPGTYYIVDDYSMGYYLKNGKARDNRTDGPAISYITLEEVDYN